MGLEGFCGLSLIAAGPAAILYIAVIAQKSFLVLLTLARYAQLCSPVYAERDAARSKVQVACSAFYWLLILLLISALMRGKPEHHEWVHVAVKA